jgi:hypothetical protein
MERDFVVSKDLMRLVGLKPAWVHGIFLQKDVSTFTHFTKKQIKEFADISYKTQDVYFEKLVNVGALEIMIDSHGKKNYKLTNKFNPYI